MNEFHNWVTRNEIQDHYLGNNTKLVGPIAREVEKENSEFKPVKLRLKINLVSYPVRAEGLGKYG